MNLTIKTNNVPRDIISGFELPDNIKPEFDYMDNVEGGSFIRYKNDYYDIGDFVRTDNNGHLKEWDGYTAETYFSGVAIKLVDDDQAIMCSYYC